MRVYFHPSLNQVELGTVMQALSDSCWIAVIRGLKAASDIGAESLPLQTMIPAIGTKNGEYSTTAL
jgi:hypothetical protein